MLSTESGFSENIYRVAATERLTTVNQMLDEPTPDFVTITYLSGVAVECILHAYRMRSQINDTAKHDLRHHADISGFYDGMTSKERQRISGSLTEIVTRWQNNHRYRSEDALRSYIIKHRLFIIDAKSTTREDAVQYNASKLVEAANEIVTTGVRRWTL